MKFSSSTLFATVVSALSLTSGVEAGFEWAGTFPMADTSHTWSMQKVGGSYADPSMRIVLFAADTADQDAIEMYEESAEVLIESDSCAAVEAGETVGPVDSSGSCYELVNGSGDDSLFPMDTSGLSAIVVFAQHFPTEFERDMHYLKDSAGTDIEPAAQEGGDGHDHDHHHDHDHGDEDKVMSTGQSCACASKELGFNIDCTASTAMIDAFNTMKSAGCGTDCSSDICVTNWHIVQSHHDYCSIDVIPSIVEDGFHDFDEVCMGCDIARIAMAGAPNCPAPNCEDDSGNAAYTFLVENTCEDDCSSMECAEAYLTLRVVHDSCDHDALTTASEEGLHDYEDVCNALCNTPESLTDQLLCTEEESAGASASSVAAIGGALFGAVFLMMA